MLRRLLVLALLTAAACGPGRMPTGPAPIYEEPTPPTWLRDGGASPPAEADAGLSPS